MVNLIANKRTRRGGNNQHYLQIRTNTNDFDQSFIPRLLILFIKEWNNQELDQSLAGDCIVDKIISKSNLKLMFLYRQTRDVNLKTKQTNANYSTNPMPAHHGILDWPRNTTARLQCHLEININQSINRYSSKQNYSISFEGTTSDTSKSIIL